MPKQSRQDPQPAVLSREQIRQGIRTIDRRTMELEQFDFSVPEALDARSAALLATIRSNLATIFGPGTIEHQNFDIYGLFDPSAVRDRGPFMDHHPEDYVPAYQAGVKSALESLRAAKKYLAERLEDSGDSDQARSARALKDLNLHPQIAQSIEKKFADGHYADAIETACKVLNNLVQNKAGVFDIDNTKLMQRVFARDKPLLSFNDLANDDLKNEQQGMMFLFAGAMQGLRNPRAHRVIEDHVDMAVEAIAFISLLAKYLDSSQKL